MDFIGEPAVEGGVVERRFDVECEGRVVPGIVWTPDGVSGTRPLVLIGHGGTGHKRMDYVLALARRSCATWLCGGRHDGPGTATRGRSTATPG